MRSSVMRLTPAIRPVGTHPLVLGCHRLHVARFSNVLLWCIRS